MASTLYQTWLKKKERNKHKKQNKTETKQNFLFVCLFIFAPKFQILCNLDNTILFIFHQHLVQIFSNRVFYVTTDAEIGSLVFPIHTLLDK